jgi:hypothetical protein
MKRAGSASRQENRASVDLKQNHDTGKHANQPSGNDGLSPDHDGKLVTWFTICQMKPGILCSSHGVSSSSS